MGSDAVTKALAIREPWATLIGSSRKLVECRTWRTHYRGPLVIVASSKVALDACRRYRVEPQPSTLAALVVLVDVRPWRRGDARRACMPPVPEWHLDDYLAWALADARPLRRVPFLRSRLGVFELPKRLRITFAR